jgi:hypothetical protein
MIYGREGCQDAVVERCQTQYAQFLAFKLKVAINARKDHQEGQHPLDHEENRDVDYNARD